MDDVEHLVIDVEPAHQVGEYLPADRPHHAHLADHDHRVPEAAAPDQALGLALARVLVEAFDVQRPRRPLHPAAIDRFDPTVIGFGPGRGGPQQDQAIRRALGQLARLVDVAQQPFFRPDRLVGREDDDRGVGCVRKRTSRPAKSPWPSRSRPVAR